MYLSLFTHGDTQGQNPASSLTAYRYRDTRRQFILGALDQRARHSGRRWSQGESVPTSERSSFIASKVCYAFSTLGHYPIETVLDLVHVRQNKLQDGPEAGIIPQPCPSLPYTFVRTFSAPSVCQRPITASTRPGTAS